MSRPGLHLLVPGLLGPIPAKAGAMARLDGDACDDLALLLARGRRRATGDGFAHQRAFRLLDVPLPDRGDVPVGACCALGDGFDPGDSVIYRADPVHLVPDRDRLRVTAPESLSLPADAVEEFAASFNALFRDDGLELLTHASGRWYLRCAALPDLETVPLPRALGADLRDCLPGGGDATSWIRRQNTIQMLLHDAELNRRRLDAGESSINSLWLWGGGPLPASPVEPPSWRRVYGEDPLIRGLARLRDLPTGPLPEPGTLLEQGAREAVLVSLPGFPAVMDSDSFGHWEAAVREFAEIWAGPLRHALGGGHLPRLVLETERVMRRVTPLSLRLPWRRRRRLRHWLEVS